MPKKVTQGTKSSTPEDDPDIDWDPLSETPPGIEPNWIQCPENLYCPEAGWNHLLKIKYLWKKEGNQGWRTTDQIGVLIKKLEIHGEYNEEKKKELNDKKRFHKEQTMPELLKRMKEKAIDVGKVATDIWSLNTDEDGKVYLQKKEKRSGKIWKITKGLDESYSVLKDLHLAYGHLNGSKMAKELDDALLYCWPRDLVNKFPNYCLECRKGYVMPKLRKQLEDNKREKLNFSIIKKQKKETIVRQGDLVVVRPWTFNDHSIVSALDMRSSYLQHAFLSTLDQEEILQSLIMLFTNTMFPKRLSFDFSQTSSTEGNEEMASFLVKEIQQLVPEYKVERLSKLNEKQEILLKDCFSDFLTCFHDVEDTRVSNKLSLGTLSFNCQAKWTAYKNQLRNLSSSAIELLSQESVDSKVNESSESKFTQPNLQEYLNTSDKNPMEEMMKEESGKSSKEGKMETDTSSTSSTTNTTSKRSNSTTLVLNASATKGKTGTKRKNLSTKKRNSTTPVAKRTRKGKKEKKKQLGSGVQDGVNSSKDSEFNFEEFEYSYDRLLGWQVGRSMREHYSDRNVVVDRGYCNACCSNARRSTSIGEFAFICLDCTNNEIVSLSKLGKATKRVNTNCCTLCGQEMRGKPHTVGKSAICRICIHKKKSPCYVCSTLKGNVKAAIGAMISITNKASELIPLKKHISYHTLKEFLSGGQVCGIFRNSLDTLSTVSVASVPADTSVLQVYDKKLSLAEFRSFGKYEIINKRGQGIKHPKWVPTGGEARKLSENTFDFFGTLLSNAKVKYLGVLSTITALKDTLEGIYRKEKLFNYDYIFCYIHHQEKVHMASYVLDVRSAEFSSFNSRKDWIDQFGLVVKKQLTPVFEELSKSEKQQFTTSEIYDVKHGMKYAPLVDDHENEEKYRYNTSFLALVHTWLFTMVEWKDDPEIIKFWDELGNDHYIERLRMLFMLFALSGDFNLLLYRPPSLDD